MRIAGVLLIALSLIPLDGWLRSPENGLAGIATADMAASASSIMWAGALGCAAIAIVFARLLDPARADRLIAAAATRVRRPTSQMFAFAVAGLGGVMALAVSAWIFHFQPVLIDSIAQLIHARSIASGLPAAVADPDGFFRVQQSVNVDGGWISQYPPFQVYALAAGTIIGAPWIVGPLMLAVALYFSSRAVDLLFPGRAAARVGVLAAAVSPFMTSHAAAYMSHTTAAACIAIACYAFGRAAAASAHAQRWLLLCGVAIGCAFATRPLTGVVVGCTFAVMTMLVRKGGRGLGSLAAGALPGIIAVALYNAHFFGAPTRFGYDVALGPSAGLGFGTDPWGNAYGVRQAIAFTGAELRTMSLYLFESPLPYVALIGAFMFSRRAWSNAERLVGALVVVPLLAHLLYWHHGLFMGPRMLNEYGILWSIAAALSCAGLLARTPSTFGATLPAYSPRSFLLGMYCTAAVAAILLAPQRLLSYSVPPSEAYATASTVASPALIFVHGGWTDRIAMQLAGRGWRLDVVETALRQNSTCAVQQVVDGTRDSTTLDFTPRATGLPRRMDLPRGSAFRVREGEQWTPACARQVAADTAGVVDPSTLLWRGAVRGGAAAETALFARDLGPENNGRAIDTAPAYMLRRTAEGRIVIEPYEAGMLALWSTQ